MEIVVVVFDHRQVLYCGCTSSLGSSDNAGVDRCSGRTRPSMPPSSPQGHWDGPSRQRDRTSDIIYIYNTI